jgi:hypothetical protein
MLDLLVHDPDLRRQAAARGRERIQGQYLWPEIARSIEKAYYDLLGWGASELAQCRTSSAAASLGRASIV